MDNFLSIFQEFNKNKFEYKKPQWEVNSQATSDAGTAVEDVWFFTYKCNTNSASQTFPEEHFLWLYRSEVNQGVRRRIFGAP